MRTRRAIVPPLGALALVALAVAAAPAPAAAAGDEPLRPGAFVEVSGPLERPRRATKVRVREPEAGAAPEKLEVTAPADTDLPLEGTHLVILGIDVEVTPETTFEDEAKDEVARFFVHAGDWVKAKVRAARDGTLKARTIRRAAPRDHFSVEGLVGAVDPAGAWLEIAGVEIDVPPGEDLRRSTKVVLPGETDDKLAGPGEGPLGLFFRDEQKGVPFTIELLPDLFLGGQITGEGRHEDNRRLDEHDRRDKEEFLGEAKLDLLWVFDGEGSFLLAEGTFGGEENLVNWHHEETQEIAALSRGYVYWAPTERLRVQVGRQDFDEEREWIYDEVLDAVRLHWKGAPLEAELSASFGRQHLDQPNETEGIFNAIALVRWHLAEKHRVTAYAIERKETRGRAGRRGSALDRRHYGLRSFGRPGTGLRHWLELALAEGTDEDGTEILGFGVDGGLSYVVDAPWRPALTVGAAWGSGDDERDPGARQSRFRQTGLEDNNARQGGVTSYRYYGELLDPELTNLLVTTAIVGVRPVRSFSIDLAFHTYHQDEAVAALGPSNLRATPTGDARFLGWEGDLVLGYRYRDRFNAELILGMFEPGPAFEEDEPAFLVDIQARFKF